MKNHLKLAKRQKKRKKISKQFRKKNKQIKVLFHALDMINLTISALEQLDELISTEKFETANVSLRNALKKVEVGGNLGPSRDRHKVVRVVNLDNL